MRGSIRTVVAAVGLALMAVGAGAQPPGGQPRPQGNRPAIQRLEAAVRRQLGLTDRQAAQLRTATRQFAAQRERLNREERATRLELRAAVAAGEGADTARVSALLDDLLRIQRRRLDVLAEEQRELARFLTPVQRARYMALQERALRAAQQVRARREAQGRAGESRRPLPPP